MGFVLILFVYYMLEIQIVDEFKNQIDVYEKCSLTYAEHFVCITTTLYEKYYEIG